MSTMPEKARLLDKLSQGGFKVPSFLYVPPETFISQDFAELEAFLKAECEGHKVIVRSGHLAEEFFNGGTFESLETYADVGGVKFARNRIINAVKDGKSLSIMRQQKFNGSPQIEVADTGVVVMPFIEGSKVMAKIVGDRWEFGYCRTRSGNFECEPYVTQTPHDLGLLNLSKDIQQFLGFKCEIEFIIGIDRTIYVVQAKDISKIDTSEIKAGETSLVLDGLRRIRRRRNYRERPIFVMDNHAFYLEVISLCEALIEEGPDGEVGIDDIVGKVHQFEEEMVAFALRHERFAVLGLCIVVPDELFQVANHYLDDYPELQHQLSTALFNNTYKVDQFLSEADTLIARDAFRRNLCTHDAYGINTVRYPIWTAYWLQNRHADLVRRFKDLGYTTGDWVGIEVDENDTPTIFRY